VQTIVPKGVPKFSNENMFFLNFSKQASANNMQNGNSINHTQLTPYWIVNSQILRKLLLSCLFKKNDFG
jgi:hypothetical protein